MSEQLTIHIPNDRGHLYSVIKYPAGEIQVRLTDAGMLAVIKADEYVIEANPMPDPIELAQLNDAVNSIGHFGERTVYLPYLPFSRADRRFKKGDAFGLRTYLKLLRAMDFTHIQTFDVHSGMAKIQTEVLGMDFMNVDPVKDDDQLTPIIKRIGPEGLCLIRPDKGSINRYDLESLGFPILQGDKVREPITGKLSGFHIDPRIEDFQKALIVDDICDGGGTFVGLGQEIKRLNPNIKLYLYTSHGIYSQGEGKLKEVFEELFNSGSGYDNGQPKEVLG